MKRTISMKWHVRTLVMAAMIGSAWAQQSGAPAVTTKTTTAQATVQAVYPDKRSVTLLGPQGPTTVFVGPNVKLDRIHAGDKVKVSYYQGIAAQIAKGSAKVSDPAASTFTYKNPTGQPGGGVGASLTVTVTIVGVDPGTNTVAFKSADGTPHIIAVRSPNMREFIKTLKAGDVVDVTYTESLAISVEPAS
jgi:hypothetical protein